MKHVISHQRGRPKKDDCVRRDNRINIRLTEETYDRLVRLSTRAGRSISDYARFCIEEMMDREEDRERYGYDDY